MQQGCQAQRARMIAPVLATRGPAGPAPCHRSSTAPKGRKPATGKSATHGPRTGSLKDIYQIVNRKMCRSRPSLRGLHIPSQPPKDSAPTNRTGQYSDSKLDGTFYGKHRRSKILNPHEIRTLQQIWNRSSADWNLLSTRT
jgi:hypothetical protein